MSGIDDGAADAYDDIDDADGARPPRRELTPAQRRARRQTITLLLVSGMLLVGFIFAAAYYEGWFSDGKPTAGTGCTTAPVSTIKPSQVKLNVYNASKRNGLAKRVAAELKTRGFTVDKITNDPLSKNFKQPVEVRYGPKGKAAARFVSSEVTGAHLVADKRKDATVDFVLGSAYTQLLTAATPGATPAPSCTPTPTGTSTTPAKGTTTAHPTGTKTKK